METKREVLQALHEEFDRWKTLLSGLDEHRMVTRDMPSGLSIKDVMAHLMAWQQLSRARLQAGLNNSDPTYHVGPAGLDPDAEENLELINAWIHETYADEPWPKIYRLWRDGFQAFLALGEALPEQVLIQPGRFEWLRGAPLLAVLVGSYAHHHDEHYQPLMVWLDLRDNTA